VSIGPYNPLPLHNKIIIDGDVEMVEMIQEKKPISLPLAYNLV
jgi:hypothetical protein